MKSDTVFVLGRTPDLAFAELIHSFPQYKLERIHDHAAIIADLIPLESSLIDKLGGTTLIGSSVAYISEVTPPILASFLPSTKNSLTFGISTLGQEGFSEQFLREIKKNLSEKGISSRYIVNKKNEPLSAIVTKGQKVNELILIPTEKGNLLVKTELVQNIPQWVHREFDRPYADPKRGMLPPKVAKMLINIAGIATESSSPSVLLDPFCGMGTILAEALLDGWDVIGSDLSKEVVGKAEANLQWLTKEYSSLQTTFKIFQSDAVHISQYVTPLSVNAVVTEPFMGSPEFALQKSVDHEAVKNTVKGLEKMYIGALKDWHKILKANGIVLIALPKFRLKGRELFVKKVIDSCEILGYSVVDGPWTYSRPHALVERNFYLLQKR